MRPENLVEHAAIGEMLRLGGAPAAEYRVDGEELDLREAILVPRRHLGQPRPVIVLGGDRL